MRKSKPSGWGGVGTICLLLLLLDALTAPAGPGTAPGSAGASTMFLKRSDHTTSTREYGAGSPHDRHPDDNWLAVLTRPLRRFANGDEEHVSYLPIVHRTRRWTDCSQSSFGTMLIYGNPGDWITPAEVLIYANDHLEVKGLVGTGAPSDQVRDEWFGRLPGWTRLFMRGTYDALQSIHWAATTFGMENMYECFAYGPESPHQAGQEALDPVHWVPQAEALAEGVGKCLVYAPSVQDYELLATPEGEDQPREDSLADLIAQVAPHVDIWVVQLGKYQPWVDAGHDDQGNPYTMDDFRYWIAEWVSWIKAGNSDTRVWTQLGIGQRDPIEDVCLPPQPPEYILNFRETLVDAGVDGIWVMPAQPCQPCPPSPPPDFPCSTDPQDIEYYQQSLATLQQAIEMACGD